MNLFNAQVHKNTEKSKL